MRESGNAVAYSPTSVEETGSELDNPSGVDWIVTSVEALPDFTLSVQFIDGVSGTVKMRDFVFSEKAGVFESLRNAEVFRTVSCEEGFVMWPNGLDLAPDAMHDRLVQHDGSYTIQPSA